jgi:hypothetical protein
LKDAQNLRGIAVVGGEIYQACKVNAYVPEIGEAAVLINAMADMDDVHVLCTDLCELTLMEFVEHTA